MANDAQLRTFRLAMDDLNRRLAALLHERAALARAIGAWKREHGMAPVDPAREAAMLAQVEALGDAGGFCGEALRRIFAAVFAESRAIVQDGAPPRR